MSWAAHEYVPRNLGHSTVACKWCAGTPNENAVLGPDHCDARAQKDPAIIGRNDVTEKVDDTLSNDATRYVVVGMHSGNGPDAFKVVAIEDSEGKAKEKANELAAKEEGAIFGVFQKLGTARLVKKVEWTGQRG